MDIKIKFYKKNLKGNYDNSFTILGTNDLMTVKISRRIFEINNANVLIDNTDKFKQLYDIVHNDIGCFDNYNKVKIFFDDELAFVGIIKNYKYDEDRNTFYLQAADFTYKLMRHIDCQPQIIFKNTTAFNVIRELFKHAGIDKVAISDELKDYKIEKEWKVTYENIYVDVLEKIFKTLYARFNCKRDGSFEIVRCYPAYDKAPICDHKFESIDLISSGEYERNESDIQNKLIVKSNDKDAQAFICPYLLKHCNNEIFLDSTQEELADTYEKKWNLALKYFRDKLRHSKKFTITTVNGDLKRDIGNIVRVVLNQSNVKGWAMINGITSNIEPGNYYDEIELELLVADFWVKPEKSQGNYNIPTDSKNKKKNNETYVNVKGNKSISFKIDKSGKIKLGFIDIEKQSYLEIKSYFATLIDTKHYDLVIQDPNKAFYGYKQQILKDVENPIMKNDLNSCQKLSYSGWKGTPEEYFKIYNPIAGRWYVYLQSDTKEDYTANITVNMDWKKVQIDG
ncbi:hypothetical protein [Clostridium novyi]|uniref:hypothetical protein n=1 Tax=Clostridium novyi TaxID=1542 RepID=UPI0004D46C80|nr:hypothetical protein [Clostridium novyi]KEI08002.1 hypothetical protein Z958_p0077 [Clostridium novyi B str. NCTC 9691]KEI12797.1 hypothetical protein Z958_05895 [Clostridium novyi B str. NCTC 9691]